MAGRISQSVVHVLQEGNPSSRISQSFVQVLIKIEDVINETDGLDNWNDAAVAFLDNYLISDDLDSWGDVTKLVLTYEINVADDLNNWGDEALRNTFGYAEPLDLEVSDWLSKTIKKGKSLINTWNDGLEFTMDAADIPLYLAIEDLGYFTDDELVLGLGLIFTDTLALTDSVAVSKGHLREAYDSMQYNWLDYVAVSYLLSTSSSDNLDNWLDLLATKFNTALGEIGDTIVFSDELAMQSAGFQTFADDLNNLTDAITISVGGNPVEADDLDNWGDGVATALSSVLTLAVGDDLDNLADGFDEDDGILVGASDLTYIRRYMNDVN
jgi:hypothetical protein